MELTKPMLRYACRVNEVAAGCEIEYRGRRYAVPDARFLDFARRADGRREPAEACRTTEIEPERALRYVRECAGPCFVDGSQIVRADGALSGDELFLQLEDLLFSLRREQSVEGTAEAAIADGSAPLAVVRGFCIENAHLVSNAGTEIALALAGAGTKSLTDLYRQYFLEEHSHGQILQDGLRAWMPQAALEDFVPLPATAGLIHSYNDHARQSPLLYAASLVNDEATSLDAVISPEADPYVGMAEHYDVPHEVTKKFRWHAYLDRESEHGLFVAELFNQFPVVNPDLARRAKRALREVVELRHELSRSILREYSRRDEAARRLT